MDRYLGFFGLLCLGLFIQGSEASYMTERSDLIPFESIDALQGLFDICKCANLECNCCISILRKIKACSSMKLMEEKTPEGKPTLAIDIKLRVKDKTVFSKHLPVADIPPICYGFLGAKVCGRISFRREMDDIKICGSIFVAIHKKVLHEYELYCLKLPFPKPKNDTLLAFGLDESGTVSMQSENLAGGLIAAAILNAPSPARTQQSTFSAIDELPLENQNHLNLLQQIKALRRAEESQYPRISPISDAYYN